MHFFRKKKEPTIFEQDYENTTAQRLPYTLISQSNNSNPSFLSEMNFTFSFSDLICSVCLCLVPIFGIAGLALGFAVLNYLSEYMKNNLSNEQITIAALSPFGIMLLCMAVAFVIWGKSIDRARGWEIDVAERRGPGLFAACQEFVSSSNPCLVQIKERLNSLVEPSLTLEQTENLGNTP